MPEPPDKSKVVRLVKKGQISNPAPVAPPAKEDSAFEFKRPHRPSPPFRRENESSWTKKPFRKTQGPRAGARPPQGRPKAQPSPPRPAKPSPIVLTEEQRTHILDIYKEMVTKGERPSEGRRIKIATLLNIPYAAVAEVVKGHVTHERYRRTNFEIEKLYWQSVRQGEKNAGTIAQHIAAQLNLDAGRVWWWLEKLHEPRKSFAHDPELEEANKTAILSAYETYLQQTEPPEAGLHHVLAEQAGHLTPRQIHKVLWAYRNEVWQTLEGREKPQAIVQPNESGPSTQS